MKGASATGIAILLLAPVAIAGAFIFAWPILNQEPPAPISSARAPSPTPAPTPAPAPAPAPVTEAVKTLKGLTDQVGPRADRSDREPSFDVARIEPNGEAVIAGHAAPGATVELLRGGVSHARTVAGPSGDFVMVPDNPLPAGTYDLTLRAAHRDGKVSTSKNSVAVALRSGGPDKPVVAAAPDKPAVAPRTPDEPVLALAAPGKPDVAPPKPIVDGAATIDLAIGAVKGEAGGGMYVSGRAAPGMRVNLYLNDAYIASATASADGRVAFSIQSGIRPGDYRVRLEQLDTSGRVQKRVEVPFKAPAMLAAAPAPPKAQPPKPDAAPSTTTAAASASSDRVAPPAAARGRPAAEGATPAGETRVAAGTSAAEETKAAGGTSAAGEKRIAGETTRPAPSESNPRIVSAAPAADPTPAAPQPAPEPKTAPAAHGDADAPVRQPPPPPPAMSEVAASQQPASQQPAPGNATPPASAPTPSAEKDGKTNVASANVVVIPHVETTVVTRGDSLWRISESTYGQGIRYPTIYNANRDNIRDPDLIYPGQIFVLPKDGP